MKGKIYIFKELEALKEIPQLVKELKKIFW